MINLLKNTWLCLRFGNSRYSKGLDPTPADSREIQAGSAHRQGPSSLIVFEREGTWQIRPCLTTSSTFASLQLWGVALPRDRNPAYFCWAATSNYLGLTLIIQASPHKPFLQQRCLRGAQQALRGKGKAWEDGNSFLPPSCTAGTSWSGKSPRGRWSKPGDPQCPALHRKTFTAWHCLFYLCTHDFVFHNETVF